LRAAGDECCSVILQRCDLRFDVFIEPEGLAAINVGVIHGTVDTLPPATTDAAAPKSKRDLVLELLGREGGATLAELIDATSRLPHTPRGTDRLAQEGSHHRLRQRQLLPHRGGGVMSIEHDIAQLETLSSSALHARRRPRAPAGTSMREKPKRMERPRVNFDDI